MILHLDFLHKKTYKMKRRVIPETYTSALVIIQAPASLAALPIAKDTAPIPPSTYLPGKWFQGQRKKWNKLTTSAYTQEHS